MPSGTFRRSQLWNSHAISGFRTETLLKHSRARENPKWPKLAFVSTGGASVSLEVPAEILHPQEFLPIRIWQISNLKTRFRERRAASITGLNLSKLMFCHFAENNLTEVLRTATQNLYPTLNFANLLQSMKLSIPIDNTDDPIRYVFFIRV